MSDLDALEEIAEQTTENVRRQDARGAKLGSHHRPEARANLVNVFAGLKRIKQKPVTLPTIINNRETRA
jgi:hypothetical protein